MGHASYRQRQGASKFSDWVTDGGLPPSVLSGQSNSSTQHSVSSHVPSVVFPRPMGDTARNVDSLSAPQLSTSVVEWDGSLKTLRQQANLYLGPDLSIATWLSERFGDDPGGKTSKEYRQVLKMQDGQIKYHDVLAMAKEWDKIGPAQPSEFVAALRLEVDL